MYICINKNEMKRLRKHLLIANALGFVSSSVRFNKIIITENLTLCFILKDFKVTSIENPSRTDNRQRLWIYGNKNGDNFRQNMGKKVFILT